MKQNAYLILSFVALAIVLLILLSQSGREGYKTGRTPPLDPNVSMKQVNAGVSKLGRNGYIQNMSGRIGALEQKYPDVSEDQE
jgi:hypothetical protein